MASAALNATIEFSNDPGPHRIHSPPLSLFLLPPRTLSIALFTSPTPPIAPTPSFVPPIGKLIAAGTLQTCFTLQALEPRVLLSPFCSATRFLLTRGGINRCMGVGFGSAVSKRAVGWREKGRSLASWSALSLAPCTIDVLKGAFFCFFHV